MTKENVKKRLVDFFTKNVGLKLISLVIAIIAWFAVVSSTDSPVTHTFRNVPVNIVNSGVISDGGKTMEILNNSDVVSTVQIKAPRSIIQEFGSSTAYIAITADMKNLSDDGTTVVLTATTTKYSDRIENIRLSSETLEVRIEDKKTIQLPITATISGDMEPGYVLGDIIQAQNQVRITGPESVIDRIKSASVDVQVTGFTDNISTSADIQLFDENKEEISQKNLKLNISAVKVDVAILATKKVPVKFSVMGIPAEGYGYTGEVESDIDEIAIAGKANTIADVTEIVIPSEALNITGLSSTLHSIISISKYLPSGVTLADTNGKVKANVSVYIEGYKEEVRSVFLRNIEVRNVPDGFDDTVWDMEEDHVEFVLVGLAQNLEKVQISQLNLSVDFSDYELMHDMLTEYKEGETYLLPLLMDLPEGVTVKAAVEIGVKLVK